MVDIYGLKAKCPGSSVSPSGFTTALSLPTRADAESCQKVLEKETSRPWYLHDYTPVKLPIQLKSVRNEPEHFVILNEHCSATAESASLFGDNKKDAQACADSLQRISPNLKLEVTLLRSRLWGSDVYGFIKK